ncbi:MAG: response regulator [Anaerolineaceae bacterium]|nr:response regulator [Anaerolineaceae bacterium]
MPNSVLVVDDDVPSRVFLTQTLRPLPVDVIEAVDGAEAIELLEQNTPRIVFLDMYLPRVGGLDVLGYILDTPRLNNTIVVIVSAHEHVRFPSCQELDRADEYLVKPVSLKVLRDLTQRALSGQFMRG